ncbi:MAG: adenylyl-sulfate kinase [Flavobacteriales bacterium]|jgi:adenylylsulfate kinase|tara:strand:+ start:668 stop:1273 length:606 start_codon:yes stop_codon:yes gene_type:complete
MPINNKNIHPIHDSLLNKEEKEAQLNQKAITIWMTGLSGSGKSTIAKHLERSLSNNGFITKVLDGDNVRIGICNNLDFSTQDRIENIRRISEISKLFIDGGIITINSFISPTIEIRKMAKDIIGPESFFEIFVDADLETCEKRDVKGLYAKARKGEIKDFTGISAPFEKPINADLVLDTNNLTVSQSVEKIITAIKNKITY